MICPVLTVSQEVDAQNVHQETRLMRFEDAYSVANTFRLGHST